MKMKQLKQILTGLAAVAGIFGTSNVGVAQDWSTHGATSQRVGHNGASPVFNPGRGFLRWFRPNITDNAEPTKVEIERRFEVPALSVTGSEAWLGPWTFSLPMGSLTDEPVFWVEQMVANGFETAGALIERSRVGHSYITGFRDACARAGIRIVSEQLIPQTAQDITEQVTRLHADRPDVIVHCGFGFGMAMTNMVLASLDWDPPRYMSTAFENAWLNDLLWQAMLGWTGCDQYDEGNPVGGWYGLRTGYRGRFAMYVPPLLERLGLVELEHNPRNNRVRAV